MPSPSDGPISSRPTLRGTRRKTTEERALSHDGNGDVFIGSKKRRSFDSLVEHKIVHVSMTMSRSGSVVQ